MTPMWFTDTEMKLLAGTNLYMPALQQRGDWREEHKMVQTVLGEADLTC